MAAKNTSYLPKGFINTPSVWVFVYLVEKTDDIPAAIANEPMVIW